MEQAAEHHLVSLGVMARLLHVPTKWLRNEAETGRIPALKAGERFVFRPDVVVAIVADLAAGKKLPDAERTRLKETLLGERADE